MTDRKWLNRYWGDRERPKSKSEFFDAVTAPAPAGTGTVATIRLYGPIDSWGGYWGISTKDVSEILDALPDSVVQIILRINSPGGEVFEAVSILNMFRAHKATVTAVVDGLAASAASVLAAGCDETVMSPGAQMMIHSPSTIVWGNAAVMRKEADVLDIIEASIIEVYVEKAGDGQDWPALLAEETWLTAARAVELGLADRVAVVPDAGETETAGEDDEELVVVPLEGDDVDDIVTNLHVRHHPARVAARAQKLPSSSEPGDPNRKEHAVAKNSDLAAGLRERLGMSDADTSDEQILAALDERLAAPAATLTQAPEGTVLMDAAQLEELRAAAEEGRQARAQQAQERRDRIVNSAVEEGRIAPSSRDAWLAQLAKDEDGAAALLNSLAPNTIPVAEIGHSDTVNSADEALYTGAGWTPEKGA